MALLTPDPLPAPPTAPSVTETPTGINVPGTSPPVSSGTEILQGLSPEDRATVEARLTPEQIAARERADARAARDHNAGSTVSELGAGAVQAQEDLAQQNFESDTARYEAGQDLQADVEADVDEATSLADAALSDMNADADRIQQAITDAGEAINKIPDAVESKFDELSGELAEATNNAFTRVESREGDALANVEQGRAAALQAAVQGIQGNVNNQVAKIMANPNLTSAQKASMVAQTKLQGASSMAPAIGATVLDFNKLSADVATKFGAIVGNLEGVGLTAKGSLIEAEGSAYAQTQVAVGQMTNQLLDIDATASAAFATSSAQLLAQRSQAQMTGNQIRLNLMPEMGTPVLNLTDAASAAYQIASDIQAEDLRRSLQEYNMELTRQLVSMDQMSGLAQVFDFGLGLFGIEGGGEFVDTLLGN